MDHKEDLENRIENLENRLDGQRMVFYKTLMGFALVLIIFITEVVFRALDKPSLFQGTFAKVIFGFGVIYLIAF